MILEIVLFLIGVPAVVGVGYLIHLALLKVGIDTSYGDETGEPLSYDDDDYDYDHGEDEDDEYYSYYHDGPKFF